MTPKEKAQELVDKFYSMSLHCMLGEEYATNQAKQCALIAVDEIIRVLDEDFDDYRSYYIITVDEYWQEVKYEMEIL